MASSKITALANLAYGNIVNGDQFVVVDVSDTTMAPTGTDKNYTFETLIRDQHQIARLSGDQSSSSTSLADVPGLSASLVADATYRIEVIGGHTTGTTTTESMGISINGSTAASNVIFTASCGQTSIVENNIFVGHAYDDVTPTYTNGPGATERRFNLVGVVKNGGSASTLSLRFKAETGGANSVTIKAGTVMLVTRIG